MEPSIRDLKLVVEKNPDLSYNGFRYNGFNKGKTKDEIIENFKADRERLEQALDEFRLCCRWLSHCDKRKTMNTKIGSYGMKHYVERWGRNQNIEDSYVSNGVFIAAAIHMGFGCKPIFDNPNAYFNISNKSSVLLEGKAK